MKYILFLLLNITLFSQTSTYPLGVNLTNDWAFIDMIKHTNRYSDVEEFDENGWPTDDFQLLVMDGRPVAEWSGSIDDPEEYRIDYSGTYKASFKGYADLSVWGSGASIENYTYQEETNTSYFDLVIPGPPGEGHGIVNLTFTNTQISTEAPTNTGIKELKIYRPGYELETDQIFTNEYLDLCKAANFQCYRYYTVQNIWSGEPEYPEKTNWSKRKLPSDACQISMSNTIGKLDGWCWEYIIELANILKRDIWINIHISADEDYVKELANLLKSNLDPSINIYVENSNEVWSPTHMTHGPYNQALADDLGISFDQAYAFRTLQLSRLFTEVFGENAINDRVRVILAGQVVYPGRTDNHLNFINDNYGPPKEHIWATSVTTYFGTTNPDGDPSEINDGMIESILDQVTVDGIRTVQIQKAKEWELPGGCTSYEGGPHFPSGGNLDNLDNSILAHRTEDMRVVLMNNYTYGWFVPGGGLAMHFTLVGAYQRYGCWGLTDDPTKPYRNHKMQAMVDLLGEWEEDVSSIEIIQNDVSIIDGQIHGINNIKEVIIYNYMGQVINSLNSYPWYLGELSGVYFVKVKTDEDVIFLKHIN